MFSQHKFTMPLLLFFLLLLLTFKPILLKKSLTLLVILSLMQEYFFGRFTPNSYAMILQELKFTVIAATASSPNSMTSLSPIVVFRQSKYNKNLQPSVYVNHHLPLLCPLPPPHKLHTSPSVLLAAHCRRHLDII